MKARFCRIIKGFGCLERLRCRPDKPELRVSLIRLGQQLRNLADSIVEDGAIAVLHPFASQGAPLGGDSVGANRRRTWPPIIGTVWLLDPCPAPTTSPAWRPARYLVFRGAFAPLSTNTGQSLKIFGFVGRVGQISSNQLLLGRPSLTPAVQR